MTRRHGLLLLGLFALALLLQATRWPLRWNPIAVAYGAYVAEYRFAIATGPWHTPLTWFVGLHPPGWSLFFLGLLKAGVPASGWLATSSLASALAVPAGAAAMWRTFRSAPLALGAAAVIAVMPHRVAYALEVNNYPAIVGLSALQMMTFAAWTRGGRGAPLVVATAALAWTHLLGLLLPTAQLATVLALPEGRARLREYGRLMGAAALLGLPLLPGVLALFGEDPINAEAGLGRALGALLELLPGRYGSAAAAWLGIGLAGLGARAAWRSPPESRLAAVSWVAHATLGGLAIVLAMAAGAASPEQLPYFALLAPSMGLLIALGLRPVWGARRPGGRTQALALAGLAWAGLHAGPMLLDTALARADERFPQARAQAAAWSGDEVLLLVQIPWYLDDDKDAGDPVWRGLRAGSWDYADPGIPGLTPTDPYWGQPLQTESGGWLYTFTSPDTAKLQAVAEAHRARGQAVRVAAYGLGKDPDGAAAIRRWLGPDAEVGAGEVVATLR